MNLVHPNVTTHPDGSYTVSPGHDGRTWTITPTGLYIAGGKHYEATRQGDTYAEFGGSLDEVLFNVLPVQGYGS